MTVTVTDAVFEPKLLLAVNVYIVVDDGVTVSGELETPEMPLIEMAVGEFVTVHESVDEEPTGILLGEAENWMAGANPVGVGAEEPPPHPIRRNDAGRHIARGRSSAKACNRTRSIGTPERELDDNGCEPSSTPRVAAAYKLLPKLANLYKLPNAGKTMRTVSPGSGELFSANTSPP